jgi:hypothetical protein
MTQASLTVIFLINPNCPLTHLITRDLSRFFDKANSAHIRREWAVWAVLFSRQLKNGPYDFNFFSCKWCQTFILAEMHCPLSAHIFHA